MGLGALLAMQWAVKGCLFMMMMIKTRLSPKIVYGMVNITWSIEEV